MRTQLYRVLSPLLAALLGSCATSQQPRYAQPPPEMHSLVARVWVQDDLLMPKRAVLAGCRYWDVKGVLCVLVANPDQANMRVYADHVKCGEGDSAIPAPAPAPPTDRCPAPDPSSESGYALAKAWQGTGKIVVFTACTSPKGEVDEQYFTSIVAHEIGHQLGIEHIPASCDGCEAAVRIHPNGRKLCGKGALMNPNLEHDIVALTEPDAMAFDMRDSKLCVADPITTAFPKHKPDKSKLRLDNGPPQFSRP